MQSYGAGCVTEIMLPYVFPAIPVPNHAKMKPAQDNHDEPQTASTTRSATEAVAGKSRRRGKRAGGVSPTGAEVHFEFDGAGKRAGQSGTTGEAAVFGMTTNGFLQEALWLII